MDPEEGGGTPPRRSRRVQQLSPSPMPIQALTNPNENQAESTSNYNTAFNYQETVAEETTTIASSIFIPPFTDNNEERSTDPPEDMHPTPSQTRSRRSSHHYPVDPPNTHINVPLPTNVNIPRIKPHTPVMPATAQNQLSSESSITSCQQYTTSNEFLSLKHAVTIMQNNMNQVTTSLAHINNRTNQLQSSIESVNTNLQQNITQAVVAAMSQFQPMAETTMTTKPGTMTPTFTNSRDRTMPTSNVTSTPFQNPSPISHHPSSEHSQNNTNPDSINNPSAQSNPHITIADLINISTNPKCSFPTFTKTQNVYEWKSRCILELSASTKPIHANMICHNAHGDPQLNQNLTCSESQELFRLTQSALSTKLNTKFITIDVLRKADGIELWEMIIARFKPITKDEIELTDMNASFTSFKKQLRESDEAYIHRFEEKVTEMDFYNIKPSAQLQAVVFLSGLNEAHLIVPIMQIRQSPTSIYSNWIVDGNIKYTLQRARAYCQQLMQYAPTLPLPPKPTYLQQAQQHMTRTEPTVIPPPIPYKHSDTSLNAPNL